MRCQAAACMHEDMCMYMHMSVSASGVTQKISASPPGVSGCCLHSIPTTCVYVCVCCQPCCVDLGLGRGASDCAVCCQVPSAAASWERCCEAPQHTAFTHNTAALNQGYSLCCSTTQACVLSVSKQRRSGPVAQQHCTTCDPSEWRLCPQVVSVWATWPIVALCV